MRGKLSLDNPLIRPGFRVQSATDRSLGTIDDNPGIGRIAAVKIVLNLFFPPETPS
jgi:hypothetical protein